MHLEGRSAPVKTLTAFAAVAVLLPSLAFSEAKDRWRAHEPSEVGIIEKKGQVANGQDSPNVFGQRQELHAIDGGTLSGAFGGVAQLYRANAITADNINNVVTVDGVHYRTLSAAFADPVCAKGCTIDMRGNSSPAALDIASFDSGPNSIPVTILLGPYTYSVTQISLRTDLHIFGSGAGHTFLQSNNTTTPMFVLGGTKPTGEFVIKDLRVNCHSGNTSQIGFDIVAQAAGGLWYSNFENLYIGGDGVHECGGGGIVLDGSVGGSPPGINQFLNFTNVKSFRSQGGGPALHIKGVGGQMQFNNSEFDGQTPRDTLPNIVIEDSAFSGFVAAYSISMYETTIQRGGVGIQLRGVTNFTCDNCHFEDLTGVINMAQGRHYGNWGNAIRNSYCATGCAQAAGTSATPGSGYLVTMDASSQLSYDNNSEYSTPDNFWLGTLTNLEHRGLINVLSAAQYPAPASSFRIPVGIDSDSPGFKFGVVPFGPVKATTRISVAIPWVTPFVDNKYIYGCTVDDFTTPGTSQGIVFERINGVPSASGMNATVFNPSSGTLSGNLACWAIHP
jgi:hypothetical protein